jgi:hypothetical protein
MKFNNVFNFIISEANNILKTTSNKPIVDAIKNRRKITFDYYGPRKPKRDSVRPGKRIKVEPVAMGLSKKGNLIIRGWVEPPSVTKTGFGKGNWRTFILSRTKNVEITDETFDTKRPQYKEGDDKSMSVTYVTSDWTKKPTIKKSEKPKPSPSPVSKIEPTPKPTKPTTQKPDTVSQELPQPKPEDKPQPIEKEPVQEPTVQEPNSNDLPQPKPEVEPEETPNDDSTEENPEEKNLQENIMKIKRLMFS